MRFALTIMALAAAFIAPALAQSAPSSAPMNSPTPAPAPSGPPPAATPNTPTPSPPVFPSSIVVELKGPPATKTGIDVAITVALVTGVMGLLIASYNGWRMGSTERMKAKAAKDTEEMKLQAATDLQLVKQAFDAAQDETQRIAVRGSEDNAQAYDREKQTAIRVHEQQRDAANRLLQDGQHQDKIALEMQALQLRANVSDAEAYMAVKRLEHERNLAQANLVHTFFGKLLSESQRERDLALFALSAFVDPGRLAQLAAGGEAIVSRESLSRLAARGADDVAAVAQRVLNDDGIAIRGGVVRVHKRGNAQMAANGFVCDGDLVVTYPVVGKDEVFEVQLDAEGARVKATCLAVDEVHFLAVGWMKTGVGANPLPLRETLVRSHETHVRLAQWSNGKFIMRAGMVVAADTQESIQYAPNQSREVKQVINLRVLSEPGSAGAPVLDEDGRVAGMIFGGEPGRENSFAAPVSAIKAVLASARAARAALSSTPEGPAA